MKCSGHSRTRCVCKHKKADHEDRKGRCSLCACEAFVNDKCGALAMVGRTKCHYHGGKTPRGVNSPHFKTGRWSKDLPTRLAARFAESQSDPNLLVLREDISLLDVRLADVLGRVDTGESGELWRRLGKAWAIYREEIDPIKQAEALVTIGGLIVSGTQDYAAWADVRSLLQERVRIVESERKRLVEMQQIITAEQALVLMGVIQGVIEKHVTEREKLDAISGELRGLVALGFSGTPRRIGGSGA